MGEADDNTAQTSGAGSRLLEESCQQAGCLPEGIASINQEILNNSAQSGESVVGEQVGTQIGDDGGSTKWAGMYKGKVPEEVTTGNTFSPVNFNFFREIQEQELEAGTELVPASPSNNARDCLQPWYLTLLPSLCSALGALVWKPANAICAFLFTSARHVVHRGSILLKFSLAIFPSPSLFSHSPPTSIDDFLLPLPAEATEAGVSAFYIPTDTARMATSLTTSSPRVPARAPLGDGNTHKAAHSRPSVLQGKRNNDVAVSNATADLVSAVEELYMTSPSFKERLTASTAEFSNAYIQEPIPEPIKSLTLEEEAELKAKEAERAVHSAFMEEALEMARLALRTNETPVGCVFVYKNRVIAKGMNATNVTRCGIRHAEYMALGALLSHRPVDFGLKPTIDPKEWINVDPEGGYLWPYGQKLHPAPVVDPKIIKECTLYVTVEPCVMCASMLRQYGIKKVYFGAVNDKFGGTGGVFRVHINSLPAASKMLTSRRAAARSCTNGTLSESRPSKDGDGGNVENGFDAEGGWSRDEAVALLRRFYVQENGRAPVPRKKEGRAARLAALMEKDGAALPDYLMVTPSEDSSSASGSTLDTKTNERDETGTFAALESGEYLAQQEHLGKAFSNGPDVTHSAALSKTGARASVAPLPLTHAPS